MEVYYTEGGHAVHYYRDCHQLHATDPDALKTADEGTLDRYVCDTCRNRRAYADR